MKPIQHTATLEELVEEINRFEAIISEWDESQRCVVVGLKRAIETLHKVALTNLIKSLKQESMSALRHAVADEVVYAVLLYHELVKPPQPPLLERIQIALAEIRPSLKSHNGDIELVAVKPPDQVEVRLIGACSSCPTSTLTLTQGVEQAIKHHCPEITQVIAVNTNSSNNTNFPAVPVESYWIRVATVSEIPESNVFPVRVANHDLILYRQGEHISCYHNSCSHLGFPLDKSQVKKGIITCASHGFEYDLKTGNCLTVVDISLRSYPVNIKGDKVYVKVEK